MRAITYKRYGPPEVLRLADIPRPEPKAGEVLVRVHASSVNSWDWDLLTGKAIVRAEGPFRPRYRILGADIAGTIAGLGEGVAAFEIGDRVFGDLSSCGWGGFAEYATADATLLARMPDDLGYLEAAAIPQAGSLALQGLQEPRPVREGDRVLINGAGGGVGTFAVQIALAAGAEVTAVDSALKAPLLRSLGAARVLDYATTDYAEGSDRYDIVLDMIGSRSLRAHGRTLKPGGAFRMVGGTLPALLGTGLGGPLRSRTGDRQIGLVLWKPRAADYAQLGAMAIAGTVRPQIERVYPLEETAAALRHIGDGLALGKLVISVAETGHGQRHSLKSQPAAIP